jgi:hypothetical protein
MAYRISRRFLTGLLLAAVATLPAVAALGPEPADPARTRVAVTTERPQAADPASGVTRLRDGAPPVKAATLGNTIWG